MADVLSHLDLVFCVDLTSSMTPFIAAARSHMARILDALRATEGVDLRVGIIGYRDHGTIQVVESYPFEKDSAATKKVLDALTLRSPVENTDHAEAVFSGLSACFDVAWREGAYRVVVLVGDAPPHACGANSSPWPDRFKDADPTGLSLDDVANGLEERGIFLHALGLTPSNAPIHDPILVKSFTRLGVGTGGSFRQASTATAAMEVVREISERCLGHLDFDRRLFAAKSDEVTELMRELDASEDAVNAGLMRLRQRGLSRARNGGARPGI